MAVYSISFYLGLVLSADKGKEVVWGGSVKL